MNYSLLWKYLLEDDVENFRQCLARATHGTASKGAPSGSPAAVAFKIGSPGALGTSPKTPKSKRGANSAQNGQLTRAVVNAKDGLGRTILHHAASSRNLNAAEMVKILLEMVPQLDLYTQDNESGWTALHRALYFGNIDIAQTLMLKDLQNAADFASGATHAQAGGLIKIKDNEGNSPFEVFASTIAPRALQVTAATLDSTADDDESNNGIDVREDAPDSGRGSTFIQPRIDLQGDEIFAFGSNKNLTLGLGDEDDRQFPERIHLRRPERLLHRLHEDYLVKKRSTLSYEEQANSTSNLTASSEIPAVVQNQPINIQEVVMSKLHTAILTDDPISNLHVTGFGPGGRLGTGDEITRFNYVCIQGGLANKRVATIALGQDHSIAICSTGEVFTWGNALDGKLGYILPEVSTKEIPMQLMPRQLYGLVKKEQIVGAAASAIHSVIYTPNALFAFGRNSGQLGLVDADARSLDIQIIPRRVGTSILQSPIKTVSAIDRATTVLLENHDVIVFTHYAWKKVIFPFEEAPVDFFSRALRTNYNKEPNSVCKVTSGGNTICALSSFGQVFTIEVPKEAEHVAASVSTTNPNKARNALPQPSRVWSIGKPHMAAADAAVGQDGSIILCTHSGSVWRKEKRASIKSIRQVAENNGHIKDYKFVRVPGLTRAIAVRSNAKGAFTVVRSDVDVTRTQMMEDPPSLWGTLFPLLAFHKYGHDDGDEEAEEPRPRFWVPASKGPDPASIKRAILTRKAAEDDFVHLSQSFEPLSGSNYDVWITSNVTDVRLPVHSFLLKARSRVLRSALAEFNSSYYFSIPDVMSIEYGPDGQIHMQFHGADFLTIVNLGFYLYTENVIDVWHYTSRALHLAPRYRQVRNELMKIAACLELRQLERAARVMDEPVRSMMWDFESAYLDPEFFSNADVVVDLAENAEMSAHSVLLCARCPFFEGLFHGLSGGMWMSSRRNMAEDVAEAARVDLKHVDARIFGMVLRHMYADTGEELFDDIVTTNLDEFIDLVIEVTSVANELMLDRLAQICQKVLGRFVTTRNVCGLLNTIAECSVTNFKDAALEYICLNLESMLEQRLLEELDDYLVEELDEMVRENQLAYMPVARSGRAEAELLDRYPELAEDLDRARMRRIDSMRLPTRFVDDEKYTPKQRKNVNDEDLPFTMDEDGTSASPRLDGQRSSPSLRPMASRKASGLALSASFSRENEFAPNSVDTDHSSCLTPLHGPVSSPPNGIGTPHLELPKAVWSATTPTESRTDLRSIMEQTSSSRVSSLTQAMAAAASVGPSRSVQKMSQSQRKKHAQEMKKQETVTKETDQTSSQPSSPWTKVSPTPQRSVTSPLSAATTPLGDSAQTMTRPNMTMRQTVAGTTGAVKSPAPLPSRNVSSPSTIQASKATPPQIQSIRHTPLPARSRSFVDAHTSMAEILAQEQADKLAIKEAAAKRSLQEIQQEQEFEAWWSAESKRVQEEEAQVSAALSQPIKGGRGRGRGGGGRKRGAGVNRGAATSSPVDEHPRREPSQPAANIEGPVPASSGGGGGGRGRGHSRHRGRGRGKPQHV